MSKTHCSGWRVLTEFCAVTHVQEAEEAPAVTIDPSDVVKLAVQLTDLNVDFDQQQYHGLPDLKDISTPTKVPK